MLSTHTYDKKANQFAREIKELENQGKKEESDKKLSSFLKLLHFMDDRGFRITTLDQYGFSGLWFAIYYPYKDRAFEIARKPTREEMKELQDVFLKKEEIDA